MEQSKNNSEDILAEASEILEAGGVPDLLEMEVLQIKQAIKAKTTLEAINLAESFLDMNPGELDYLREKYKNER